MKKLAKDMSKVYRFTSTVDLIRNRQRKLYQVSKLYGVDGYWTKKEIQRLKFMIDQIDVELAARASQMPLFENDSTPVRAKSPLISHPAHKVEGREYFEESTPEDF